MAGDPAAHPSPRMAPNRGIKGKRLSDGFPHVEKNGRPSAEKARLQGKQKLADAIGTMNAGTDEVAPKVRRGKVATEDVSDLSTACSPSQPSRQKRQRTSLDMEPAKSDVEQQEQVPDALRAISAGTSAAIELGASGEWDWRSKVEELRRNKPANAPKRSGRVFLEEVMTSLRQALQSGDWTDVTSGFPPRKPDLATAVRRLDVGECAQALKAFVERAEVNPRDMVHCFTWIHEFLEHHAEALVSHSQARSVLRELLQSLEQSLSHSGRYGKADAYGCIGKWRLIQELAAVRRTALQAPASASRTADDSKASASESSDEDGGEEGIIDEDAAPEGEDDQ